MKGRNPNKKMLKLLYRSLDGDLNEKDRLRLDEAMEQSEELRGEREKALAQRQVVAATAGRSFGPFFAEGVIHRIETSHPKKNGLEFFYENFMATFRKVAIVSAVVLMLLVSYNVIKNDILPEDELFFMADTTMEEILNLPLF